MSNTNISLNILFVTRFYPDSRIGGIERVTNLLANYFDREGYRVFNLYFEKSNYDGSIDNIISAEFIQDKYNATWIVDYLNKNKIDVIINQSHFFYTPFLSKVILNHKLYVRIIFCFHSSISLQTINRADALQNFRGIKRLFVKYAYPLFKYYSERKLKIQHIRNYKASDKVLLLSKSLVPKYKQLLGLDNNDNKIDYINNPLSFSEFVTEEDIVNKENIVLVVSRLYEPQKKLSLLFDTWRKIDNDGWKLIVVGDGEDRDCYESQTKDLTNILFVGVKNPIDCYKRAKIFAMTSLWEGLPMTILESLQMGVVPVVMNSFPAASDLIEDGKNGFLVDYPDVRAFADKVELLMHNEKLRHQMASSAVESSQCFTIDEIGMKWDNLFGKLIS